MFNQLRIEPILGFLVIPLLWIATSDLAGLASPVLFPPFFSVVKRLIYLLLNGQFLQDFYATGYRWLIGFVLGVIAGAAVGLVLGYFVRLRKLSEFVLEFFRSVPVTAIFPLFLIVFGIGDSSKIAMAFTPTFLLMVVSTTYGVTLAEPTRRRMAQVFGASKWQLFSRIVAMDALPQIFVGMRLSLSQSLIVTVVSEMFIGTDFGLGQRVYESYLTSSVTTLYALLIVLGVVGYIANRFMIVTERRALFWTAT